MLQNIKQRLGRDDEEGFTLIELMVVVLIIAILMAIAIPTFLSARGNAQQKAVESNLHNAITDEQTYFTGPGNGTAYGAATDMSSASIDNALTWSSAVTSTSSPNVIGVTIEAADTAGNAQVLLAAVGQDHNTYYVWDDNGAVTYAISKSGTAPTAAPTSTSWPTTIGS